MARGDTRAKLLDAASAVILDASLEVRSAIIDALNAEQVDQLFEI